MPSFLKVISRFFSPLQLFILSLPFSIFLLFIILSLTLLPFILYGFFQSLHVFHLFTHSVTFIYFFSLSFSVLHPPSSSFHLSPALFFILPSFHVYALFLFHSHTQNCSFRTSGGQNCWNSRTSWWKGVRCDLWPHPDHKTHKSENSHFRNNIKHHLAVFNFTCILANSWNRLHFQPHAVYWATNSHCSSSH